MLELNVTALPGLAVSGASKSFVPTSLGIGGKLYRVKSSMYIPSYCVYASDTKRILKDASPSYSLTSDSTYNHPLSSASSYSSE